MRPKELRNVSFAQIFSEEVELPEGVTKAKALGVILRLDLHMVLTHSRVERTEDGARLHYNGEVRAVADRLNAQGLLDGPVAVLHPKGGIWLIAEFKDGAPINEDAWREFTPSGIPLPGRPFEWLSWGDSFEHQYEPTLH